MTENKRFIYCFEGIEDKWETVEEYKYTPCTKDGFQDLCVMLNDLNDENEELKQSSTMYYNLFKELQRQMQGVKSIHDLDSKDFEDLIELSKGNVFTDEIGWVHLPIKELQMK